MDAGSEAQLKEAGADAAETDLLSTRNTMRSLWAVIAQADKRKLAASSLVSEQVLEPVTAAV